MPVIRNTLVGLAILGGVGYVAEKEGFVGSSYANQAEDEFFRIGELPCEQKSPVSIDLQTREVISELLKHCGTVTWCIPEYPLSLDNGNTLFTICADTQSPIIHMPIPNESELDIELDLRAVLADGQSIPSDTWYSVDANLELDKGVLNSALSDAQNKEFCKENYIGPLESQISKDLDALLQGAPSVEVVAQYGANLCDENPGILNRENVR